MTDDLTRTYRRWQVAEQTGSDEEADAACRTLFAAAAQERHVPADFTHHTMQAIAAATAYEARRARQTRVAIAVSGVLGLATGVYFGGGVAISMLSAAFLGLLDLLIGAVVGVANGTQTGTGFWSVLGGIGRAISAFVSNPTVTIAMVALQGIAIAALFALQRLLESDRESFK